MYTTQDYLYTFQNRLIMQALWEVQQAQIGHVPEQSVYTWLSVGMEVAAGRFGNLIPDEKLPAILQAIGVYGSVYTLEVCPQDACLYPYTRCHTPLYVTKLTNTTDAEMIESLILDENGNLVLKTSKQTFSVPLSHNKLAGLQGGLVSYPAEYYHLSKSMYEALRPTVEATVAFTLSPVRAVAGSSFSPVLTLSYIRHDDMILSHSLTRNGTVIPLSPLAENGIFEQIIQDMPLIAPAPLTYMYAVNRLSKPPLVLTQTMTYEQAVFYGVTERGTISGSEILSGLSQNQAEGNFQLTYTTQQQYLWVAYPKAWGLLTSILNPTGNENLPSFTQGQYPETRRLIIGSLSEDYYVYMNNLVVDISSYQLRFFF